jgi:translation elongation factor EF-Tu-like GTPase
MKLYKSYTFRARISLFSTEMGGRKNPVYNGYRPSFGFNTENHYSGQIKLIGKNVLRLGRSSFVKIDLLPARTIRKNLKPNDSFIIAEGNKIIGTGVLEKVELVLLPTIRPVRLSPIKEAIIK